MRKAAAERVSVLQVRGPLLNTMLNTLNNPNANPVRVQKADLGTCSEAPAHTRTGRRLAGSKLTNPSSLLLMSSIEHEQAHRASRYICVYSETNLGLSQIKH